MNLEEAKTYAKKNETIKSLFIKIGLIESGEQINGNK